MNERVSFTYVKDEFFSDEDKKIILKKGDVLINQNQVNTRLFLVTKGSLQGYLKDKTMENYPIFEATVNKFLGVYSYFSDGHHSYSKVVATQDSEVYYYDKVFQEHTDEEMNQLAPFFTSLLVNELSTRQNFAKHMAQEKHNDTQRLLKAEKMATLGQMAAGLAHELNNSIGVIDGGLERLSGFISGCVYDHKQEQLNQYYEFGLKQGQEVSSEEARKNRKHYESVKGLSSAQIRKLSKTGINPAEVIKLLKSDPTLAEKIYQYWEMGCTIHDIQIAAKHSTHVVRSVKQLGVSEHEWAKDVNVNNTIDEALVILRNLTKRVQTEIILGENLPATEACFGQLVQVWINIIKNGIEAMLSDNSTDPVIRVTSEQENEQIVIKITDNGPGIPQDIIQKVFEPSFTTKVGGLNFGLGLGLSIVQRIVTEHDGVISVNSEPGKTEFIVKIPLIA